MLAVSDIFEELKKQELFFFSGVPDSLLKDFCAYVSDHAEQHIIAANEGNAVALIAGYHLATGRAGVAYMQNSGEGNSLNPLISLVDPDVYGIPLLMIIGWRGEPGYVDEPQHLKQGKITTALLDTIGVPYRILSKEFDGAKKDIEAAVDFMISNSSPFALVVRKGTFEPYTLQKKEENLYELSREEALEIVVGLLGDKDIVVSTTGKTSRELYEYREELGADHDRDFLTVGSMGHASQIALGIALARKDRQVFVLDGDGAAIMHMGSMAIIGTQAPVNFKHIIFNNGCHDSVGGQQTVGFSISFTDIAKACGYKIASQAENVTEISRKMEVLKSSQGPALLEIRVKKGARAHLGRPKTAPKENKATFMRFLAD